jgi:hypothetical protein
VTACYKIDPKDAVVGDLISWVDPALAREGNNSWFRVTKVDPDGLHVMGTDSRAYNYSPKDYNFDPNKPVWTKTPPIPPTPLEEHEVLSAINQLKELSDA